MVIVVDSCETIWQVIAGFPIVGDNYPSWSLNDFVVTSFKFVNSICIFYKLVPHYLLISFFETDIYFQIHCIHLGIEG